MREKEILREGWFDHIASIFKSLGTTSKSAAAKKIADAWISEKEIDLGKDLPDDIKVQIYKFVEDRYERALHTYKNNKDPIRKTVLILVKLLDKKLGPAIDRFYYEND